MTNSDFFGFHLCDENKTFLLRYFSLGKNRSKNQTKLSGLILLNILKQSDSTRLKLIKPNSIVRDLSCGNLSSEDSSTEPVFKVRFNWISNYYTLWQHVCNLREILIINWNIEFDLRIKYIVKIYTHTYNIVLHRFSALYYILSTGMFIKLFYWGRFHRVAK